MSRGNEQKDIFTDQKDRQKFLTYLESAVVRYGAVIHAWCLMNNHYHLFLQTPTGNLSQIMRHINGAYTTYFNVKWQRAGHLFQGRYKAILIEADQYATELSRYIHLNPVRAGVADKPAGYPWSSYRSYIGQNPTPPWLTTALVLGYFDGRNATAKNRYRQFVEEIAEGEQDSPLQATVASTLLGSPDFVREISERYLGDKKNHRNVPAMRELTRRPSIDAILQKVEVELAGEKLLKNIGIYCCRKFSGATLQEIGDRFGITDAAVSQTSRRLVLKIEKDPQVSALVQRIESALKEGSGLNT
jgi:REP element-mobilizing transposase RayT